MRLFVRSACAAGALLVAAAAQEAVAPTTAVRTGLTPIQVAKLRQVTGVFPSPDAKTIAFTRWQPRLADAGPGPAYDTYLFAIGADGSDERLLVGNRKSVASVSWRPDGGAITYLADGQVIELPMRGGEARPVFTMTMKALNFLWRPDGQALAFTALDSLPEARARAHQLGFQQTVFDEDYRQVSLWLWEKGATAPRRLTHKGTVFAFEWAPTGTHLCAAIAPRNLVDDSYMFTRLHRVDLDGSVQLLDDSPGKLGDFAWSPDGSKLAYIGAQDQRDPHAGMLYVVENNVRRALTPDYRGMVHQVEWIDDGELLLAVSEGVYTKLLRRRLDTEVPETIYGGPVSTRHFAHASDGTVCFVGSTPEHPEEVFRLGGLQATRLTNSNPELSAVALGRNEVVRYPARDGMPIEGVLMYPVDYRAGTRYPMVIVAHGGPEAHFSYAWNTNYGNWGQMLCARGMFAWYPNYRASTGYGVAFAKADHGDPMGREFEDHRDAIAHFDTLGLIDKARVGIGGGSYGGYTAAWAATKHTEHFAAAVSFVPFVDIRTKWYTSDISREFYYVHYEEKWPHQQADFLAARSPLTFAAQCQTPLLLLGGTSDPRVHPSQPYMLFRAVETATKTPCRYVQYPGEGHGNRTNVYRYDYSVRTLQWFEHYLQPGDRRTAPLPGLDLDYSAWTEGGKS